MMLDDEQKYLLQFDPYRDDGEWVSENPTAYAARMQQSLLPYWPTEVLVEWFYRHARHLYDYSFLRFEKFRFEKQRWRLDQVPGREAFADPRFCENFQDIERRSERPFDWLAKYMMHYGTWNTPITLLRTPIPGMVSPDGLVIRHPIHLLEGHRRLSFLVGLRRLGKAALEHDVWIVSIDGKG